MDRLMKCLLLGLMVVYVVSPIDLCPGPVDDAILVIATLCAQK